MKKAISILFFLFISCAAFSLRWGLLSEAEDNPRALYFIDKYAKDKTITYCIYDSLNQNFSPTAVEEAFNGWPAAAGRIIKESGREDEFKDIEPILSRKVKLQQIPCGKLPEGYAEKYSFFKSDKNDGEAKEDIRIALLPLSKVPKFCGDKSSGGCHTAGLKDNEGKVIFPSIILVADTESAISILKHEIGHAFGLSDQYLSARINSNPKYGTTKVYPAIMDNEKGIMCDDAEGFINALDCFALRIKRGGDKGWQSLCPGSQEVYMNCSVKNREPFINLSKNRTSTSFTSYNEDGSIDKTEEFDNWGDWNMPHIFSYPNSDFSSVKRDKQGRVISLTDKKGNETKIDYSNPQNIRTFTMVQNEEKATVPAIYKISTGQKGNNKFFDMDGTVAGVGRAALYVSHTQKHNITSIGHTLYVNDYEGKDVYPFFKYNFDYWHNEGFAMLNVSVGKFREYILIDRKKDGDFILSCSIKDKSSKASCHCALVNDNTADLKEDSIYNDSMASFIEAMEGSSKKIKLQYSKDAGKTIRIALGHKQRADVLFGYVNNFENNYNWATGTDNQKEKGELIEALRHSVKQSSAAAQSPVLQTK